MQTFQLMVDLRMLAAAVLFALPIAAAAAGPTEHDLHTAQCVAALQANTDELAVQIKAGGAELQPLLLNRLQYGAAFIGESYLAGERDETRSKALLNAALEAQQALTAPELAARVTACAQEGAQLLARADVVSRAIVTRVAQKRMKKLLEG